MLAVAMPNNPIAYFLAVIICGVITIFYLNIGGAHGAIWTDAAEAIIMLVGVIAIFFFGIYALGGFDAFLLTLAEVEAKEAGHGALTTFPGAGGFGVIGYILVTSFGVWGMPQMISRFYTAEKQKSIKWGLVISCTWAFVVAIFAWFNGAIARAYFWKNDRATYDLIAADAGASAVPYLMIAVLPPILIGLFLASITAASLTTGEKVIMVAASGFSIDVYQVKKNASDERTLYITKITTTVVVIVAVGLALLRPGAVLAICMFAWAAMAATILIPYVFGLFWKGGTAKAVLWSGAAALIGAILWFMLFRGVRAWAAVGLTYPAALGGAAGTVIWGIGLRITIGSVHEFIVSQLIALIAFPVISKFTKSSKPADEFLSNIFDIMKRSKTEA